VSTSGGVVVAGTRVERFIAQVRHAKVIVPLSGKVISCDGEGNCDGSSGGDRDRDDRQSR